MWLANQTRIDISNTVKAVVGFAHAPKQKHWEAARGILVYMNASSSYGVTFQRGSGLELVVYTDAAYYASKETKLKSVSGAAVMCGGAAILWVSRTQECTTPSSSEAE